MPIRQELVNHYAINLHQEPVSVTVLANSPAFDLLHGLLTAKLARAVLSAKSEGEAGRVNDWGDHVAPYTDEERKELILRAQQNNQVQQITDGVNSSFFVPPKFFQDIQAGLGAVKSVADVGVSSDPRYTPAQCLQAVEDVSKAFNAGLEELFAERAGANEAIAAPGM